MFRKNTYDSKWIIPECISSFYSVHRTDLNCADFFNKFFLKYCLHKQNESSYSQSYAIFSNFYSVGRFFTFSALHTFNQRSSDNYFLVDSIFTFRLHGSLLHSEAHISIIIVHQLIKHEKLNNFRRISHETFDFLLNVSFDVCTVTYTILCWNL